MVQKGDATGIAYYRAIQPMMCLQGREVEFNLISYIPNNMSGLAKLELMYELVSQYDLVIVQRNFLAENMRLIRHAADLAGCPVIFETDDDYFHIPDHNPGASIINRPGIVDRYHEILEMADAVTTTTEECANVIYQYNKNVCVLPNNIQYIPCGEFLSPKKDLELEIPDENGNVVIKPTDSAVQVPAYFVKAVDNEIIKTRTIRIGYTATKSHRQDFETVAKSLAKVVDEHAGQVWLVIIGDRGIYERALELIKNKGRVIGIDETSNIWQYWEHIRNIDIGIAPLEPNLFNMSKSQIKAVEYGMWGTPAVLPNYVTYVRNFENEKNCLLYNNAHEFETQLKRLIADNRLRERLGEAARDLVRDFRMENSERNWKKRLDFYKSVLQTYPKLQPRLTKQQKEFFQTK